MYKTTFKYSEFKPLGIYPMKKVLRSIKHRLNFQDAKKQFDLLVYPDKKTAWKTFSWIVTVMITLMALITFVIDPLSIAIVRLVTSI